MTCSCVASLAGRNQGFKQNFTSFAEWEKTYGYANLSSTNSTSDSDIDSDERKRGEYNYLHV